MKKTITVLLPVLFLTGFTSTQPQDADPQALHLDLDMEGQEYRALLGKFKTTTADVTIARIIEVGERNLDWLKKINMNREEGDKLSFSSKDTQVGIPISAPSRYNAQIVKDRFNEVVSDLPKEMSVVLIDDEPFTDEPPIETMVYLEHGRKVDRIYQTAARWLLRSQQLNALAGYRAKDVRGYYYLIHLTDLQKKLERLDLVEAEERAKIEEALVTLCLNSNKSLQACKKAVAAVGDNAWTFYRNHLVAGRNNYNSFFEIPSYGRRRDIFWPTDRPNVAKIPFYKPSSRAVLDFMKTNVQDEWSYGRWKLLLDFRTRGNIPYVVFEPNVVPHVNGVGGNRITMDSATPLTEYNVQWTIRHEFGHVLGFPDCYLEFYDTEEKVIINYQIDTDDLMCSRKGKMNERLFKEMKENYFGY